MVKILRFGHSLFIIALFIATSLVAKNELLETVNKAIADNKFDDFAKIMQERKHGLLEDVKAEDFKEADRFFKNIGTLKQKEKDKQFLQYFEEKGWNSALLSTAGFQAYPPVRKNLEYDYDDTTILHLAAQNMTQEYANIWKSLMSPLLESAFALDINRKNAQGKTFQSIAETNGVNFDAIVNENLVAAYVNEIVLSLLSRKMSEVISQLNALSVQMQKQIFSYQVSALPLLHTLLQKKEYSYVVQLLNQYAWAAQIVDRGGDTLLHMAAAVEVAIDDEKEYKQMVQKLLESGIDVKAENKKKQTAQAIAKGKNNELFLECLAAFEQQRNAPQYLGHALNSIAQSFAG